MVKEEEADYCRSPGVDVCSGGSQDGALLSLLFPVDCPRASIANGHGSTRGGVGLLCTSESEVALVLCHSALHHHCHGHVRHAALHQPVDATCRRIANGAYSTSQLAKGSVLVFDDFEF